MGSVPWDAAKTRDCRPQHLDATGWRAKGYQWDLEKHIPRWPCDFRQTWWGIFHSPLQDFEMGSRRDRQDLEMGFHIVQKPSSLPHGRLWARFCATEMAFPAPLGSSSQFQVLVLSCKNLTQDNSSKVKSILQKNENHNSIQETQNDSFPEGKLLVFSLQLLCWCQCY